MHERSCKLLFSRAFEILLLDLCLAHINSGHFLCNSITNPKFSPLIVITLNLPESFDSVNEAESGVWKHLTLLVESQKQKTPKKRHISLSYLETLLPCVLWQELHSGTSFMCPFLFTIQFIIDFHHIASNRLWEKVA